MKQLLEDIGISTTLITNSGIDLEDSQYLIESFDRGELTKNDIIEELKSMIPENTLSEIGGNGYRELETNPWEHSEFFSSDEIEGWE